MIALLAYLSVPTIIFLVAIKLNNKHRWIATLRHRHRNYYCVFNNKREETGTVEKTVFWFATTLLLLLWWVTIPMLVVWVSFKWLINYITKGEGIVPTVDINRDRDDDGYWSKSTGPK